MIRINFENEKNGKLYFYEKTKGKEILEWAYIEPLDPDIHYKTEEGDIRKWPKDDLATFLINIYNKIMQSVFNTRVDLKSKSSQPRFGLKISGSEINLIHFFIANEGLISSLKFFGIKYQFGTKKAPGAFMHLKIIDKEESGYLSLFATDLIQEYVLNGLRDGMKMIFPVNKKDINSVHLYDPWLSIKGNGYAEKLRDLKSAFIDETTVKILKMYNIPTDVLTLLGKYMPRYLLNAKTEDFNDLSTQRIRMAEAISSSAYKTLQKAIRAVRNRKKAGTSFDSKISVDPFAILKELQDSGMLQYTQSTNPLEEINLATKITKTGIGNMKQEHVTLKKRDLNPSYYGVVAPVSTNEYGNVGNTQTLANKATITDRFGSILQKEFTDDINPFELLSASESLQPFYEYDDTTRRVMGNQQFGQFVQLDHPDEPLVQTSFESLIPHLVSDRFAIKAKQDCRVKSINKDFILCVNKDGTQTKYSIKETRSRTKRGIYIPMKYTILAKEGERLKKNDLLAATSSLKTGKLAAGKNLVVAEMSYRGMNYEDGWVITQPVQEKYEQKILERVTIIIPTDAKVKSYKIEIGKVTEPGDVLLSFTGATNIDKHIVDDLDDESPEEGIVDVLAGVEFSGADTIYHSSGGVIRDVNIKLNDKNVDSKIVKEYNNFKRQIESRKQECELLKHDQEAYVDCISDVQNTESLRIGGHSVNGSEFDGAVIEVYIEKPNKIANGSKFTLAATGGKGTVQYIVPEGQEPIAQDTKLKIEFIPTPLSIISRKNISILLLMYSGKVIYYLNKEVKKMIEVGKVKEARELLIEIFSYLDASTEKFLINELMSFFDSKSNAEILKYVRDSDPLSKPAFPLLVPPHKNKITMKNIEDAANALGIPLNEKVYVPEEGITTERAVPVGIMPVIYLEHFPKAMSSSRGSLNVNKQYTTGQGRSGTREGAGAIKLGLYDLFGMSYKEPGLLIKEIHGLHSDNKEAKNKFTREVLKSGGKMPEIFDIKIDSTDAKTTKLIETFFKGAMLDITL